MKRWQKVLLGLGSHWLFIYLPALLAVLFGILASMPQGREPSPAMIGGFVTLFAVHLLSIFFMLATIGFLIAYAVKHTRFSSNDRILWALLLAFAGALAGPVFFWMFIFPHPLGEPFFGNQP